MYKWQSLALLFFVGAINYADRTALSAVFPLVQRDLGLTDVGLAAIGSFFLWSYALGSPFAGSLADRLPRSRMIVWSLVLWSAVTLLTAVVRSQGELLACRVLLGIAECLYLPAAYAFISDHHHDETRATAMGIHMVGLNAGMVAGGTLAGYIGERMGWRFSLIVLGVVGLVLAVAARLILRDARTTRPPLKTVGIRAALADFARLGRVATFRYLTLSAMLVSIGIWMFLNWLPLYFKETFGMSLAAAGFFATFAPQSATVLGVIAGGLFSDRFSRGRPERRMIIGVFVYVAAAPFLLAFLSSAGVIAISACVFAFSIMRSIGSVNEPTIACDLLEPPLRATALGLMNMANCLAGGIGVMLAGYLKADYGLHGVFAGVSIIMLISAGMLLAGYARHYRRDRARLEAAAMKGFTES